MSKLQLLRNTLLAARDGLSQVSSTTSSSLASYLPQVDSWADKGADNALFFNALAAIGGHDVAERTKEPSTSSLSHWGPLLPDRAHLSPHLFALPITRGSLQVGSSSSSAWTTLLGNQFPAPPPPPPRSQPQPKQQQPQASGAANASTSLSQTDQAAGSAGRVAKQMVSGLGEAFHKDEMVLPLHNCLKQMGFGTTSQSLAPKTFITASHPPEPPPHPKQAAAPSSQPPPPPRKLALTQAKGQHEPTTRASEQPPPPPPKDDGRVGAKPPQAGGVSSGAKHTAHAKPSSRPSPASVLLNKQIMAAPTVADLLELVHKKGSKMDAFNLSSAISRMPKLAGNNGSSTQAGSCTVGAPSEGGPAHSGGLTAKPGGAHPTSGAAGAGNGAWPSLGMVDVTHKAEGTFRGLSPPQPGEGGFGRGKQPPCEDVQAAGGTNRWSATRPLADALSRLMLDKSLESFDARGLANSAWAFAKLRYLPDPALPNLMASAAAVKLPEFGAQQLANLSWSFVYMHHRDAPLMEAMADKVITLQKDLKPQELSNILWAFASLDCPHPGMVQALSQRAVSLSRSFKEQELSNIIWALGRLKHYDVRLYSSLLAEAGSRLHSFAPQGLSNIMWSMAANNHLDVQLLSAMVNHCGPQLGAFDGQALANMTWALATLNFQHPAFMEDLVACSTNSLERGRLNPQNVAQVLWSCAKMEMPHPVFTERWLGLIAPHLNSFDSQSLSNTIWAVSKMDGGEGRVGAEFYNAVADVIVPRLDSFSPQGVANVAWAYASACHHHTHLCQGIESWAQRNHCMLSTKDSSTLIWALTSLSYFVDHYKEGLFATLLDQVAENVDVMDHQDLADVLWACSQVKYSSRQQLLSRLQGEGQDAVNIKSWKDVGPRDYLPCIGGAAPPTWPGVMNPHLFHQSQGAVPLSSSAETNSQLAPGGPASLGAGLPGVPGGLALQEFGGSQGSSSIGVASVAGDVKPSRSLDDAVCSPPPPCKRSRVPPSTWDTLVSMMPRHVASMEGDELDSSDSESVALSCLPNELCLEMGIR